MAIPEPLAPSPDLAAERLQRATELIAEVKAGVEVKANLKRLASELASPVYSYYARLFSVDLSSELTLEVFGTIDREIEAYEGSSPADLLAWLVGILSHIQRRTLLAALGDHRQRPSKAAASGGADQPRSELRERALQELHRKASRAEGLATAQTLRSALDLETTELARLLDLPTTVVAAWDRGETEPDPDTLARLSAADDGLNRLRQMFVDDRLPQVVRRPARLFGGARALDWILDGRIAEVANRYELMLRYQS